MDRKDLERVPRKGWIAYLEGEDSDYPVKALARDFEHVRESVQMIRNDSTTADTRLADYLLDFNPAATDALVNLTLGGYFARGRIWTLHSRLRYFDHTKRRAGLPDDVAALVEKLGADSATLSLVNTNPVEPRTVIVQAGGYGEHEFQDVTIDGKTTPVAGPHVTVHLEPGSGARLAFRMARYRNQPTLAFPWDR
jgi:hypothetical protein